MSRPRLVLRFVAATAAVAVAVYLAARTMIPAESRHAVALGVGMAAAWQVFAFGVTLAAFPKNRLAAFGMGMLARFMLVVLSALVMVPAMGLPPAPTLLSLVTVLFATTLIEPVLHGAGAGNDRDR